MNEATAIREFMRLAGQEIPELPKIPSKKVLALRVNLIGEEVSELFNVLDRIKDGMTHEERVSILVDLADAVADVNYVINGTAIAFGLPAERIFEIVHRCNMAKLGGPISPSGKQLKPSGWQPPEPAIRAAIETAWANAIPAPVEQTGGVEWEGEISGHDSTPS